MGDGPLESCSRAVSQHYCETCDKELKTEELKKAHFAEHIKCAYPGCKFDAHFLVSFYYLCAKRGFCRCLLLFYVLNASDRLVKDLFSGEM